MESVIDILESLESDNSRLFKEEVLRNNVGRKLLKQVFVAVGDPYVNYYISKFKAPKPLTQSTVSDDGAVMAFLDMLSTDLATRKLTGNAAKAVVESFFADLDARQAKWCTRILLRNLRVGASESLVDKTWPGAISKFSVQLAESLEAHHEAGKGIAIAEPIEYPVRVEPKLDGLRCIAIKRNGEITMFTRSGSPIETLPTIKAALEAAPWDDFVLDAECMGRDWNESASVVMSHKTAKDDSGMILNVFDAMVFDDWRDQANDSPLEDRITLVQELVAQVASEHVVQVGGATAADQNALLKAYGKAIEGGFEGIMVKKLGSPYIFKRSDSVMKLKPVATTELVIVGHYEGNRGSKREGLWGGFEAKAVNGVITNVGGGYNDKIRAEIQTIGPDSFIGSVIECEYQPDPLTGDGFTSDGKLRFPVFCRFRDIRDVVDEKIQKIVEEMTVPS